jgi:hypothetical protein
MNHALFLNGKFRALKDEEKSALLCDKIRSVFHKLNTLRDPNGHSTKTWSNGVSGPAFESRVLELFCGSGIDLNFISKIRNTSRVIEAIKNKQFQRMLNSWLVQDIHPIFFHLKNQMEEEKRLEEEKKRLQVEQERLEQEKARQEVEAMKQEQEELNNLLLSIGVSQDDLV